MEKRSVGIDISKDTFTACVCSKASGGELEFSSIGHFKNEKQGFNQLVRWVRKAEKDLSGVNFLMEATGVYYEKLAYHLDKLGIEVNVVLPNTSKHYFGSLNIKTKTDELDAKVLSRMAVERKHHRWQAPPPVYLELRNLTRYYVQLQEEKTVFTNIKHSKEHSAESLAMVMKMNKQMIAHLDKQLSVLKAEIERVCKTNDELWSKIEKLLTIKGVGLLTIATILAETLGFSQTNSAKQLASYAGYDVVQRESGTSIKGKTRISKKGNRYIRNALYFPAMVSCRYNSILKQNYLRVIQRKSSKMIGQVAIQRKLLLLIYSLWKNDTTFDPDYKNSSSYQLAEATQDNSTEKFPQEI